MNSHASHQGIASSRGSHLAGTTGCTKLNLEFPLPWPPAASEGSGSSTPAHASSKTYSDGLLLEQQRDLALWYSSLMCLSPSESSPMVAQPQKRHCKGSTSHSVMAAVGRSVDIDEAVIFELRMRKSTASELLEDMRQLDVSQVSPQAAAAFDALQVCSIISDITISINSVVSRTVSQFIGQ